MNKMSKQEILPIAINDANLGEDDFVVSLCNIEAYNALTKQSIWPDNRLLILGEEGAGKTHLAQIWAKKTKAMCFQEPFEQLYHSASSAIIAEDIENLSERELFHLINYCTQERKSLLMTAKVLPNFKLRDLKSRINATAKILIRAPDDELVEILMHKYFSLHQVKVDQEVFEFITRRVDRSFAAITQLTAALNEASLKEKRAITIPFVKEVLDRGSGL
ncbi:MAG: chromosomal replication initiator proteinDnaA like protein [Candidatus Midichloriaceae bacterium]|jgi:chromosomal replication initiation ATPase DnaA|nr:chromosomal replication initiator proteinDnaA like protein [Candidatus Midichloriaceae bacterium]